MKIIQKTASIVLFTIMVISSTMPAMAASDSQSFSFDSLYQSILGVSMKSPVQDASIQSDSVSATAVASNTKIAIKNSNRTMIVSATGYSSTESQTDSTPFITASQTYVRDGIVAANFLPFGTAIKIPDIYGDKIFVVEDRMNQRYTNRIDVWFPETGLALKFGLKKAIKIEIVS